MPTAKDNCMYQCEHQLADVLDHVLGHIESSYWWIQHVVVRLLPFHHSSPININIFEIGGAS